MEGVGRRDGLLVGLTKELKRPCMRRQVHGMHAREVVHLEVVGVGEQVQTASINGEAHDEAEGNRAMRTGGDVKAAGKALVLDDATLQQGGCLLERTWQPSYVCVGCRAAAPGPSSSWVWGGQSLGCRANRWLLGGRRG